MVSVRNVVQFLGPVVVGGIVLAAVADRPSAQTRDADAAQAQTQALRDLVSEVRALRGVIENYTQGQAQAQTLSELLTVQQRRATDATARLDIVRRELDASTLNTRRLTDLVSRFEEALRQQTLPAERKATEAQLEEFRRELEQQTAQEAQIRARESELSVSANLEEAKWNDLLERANRSMAR